MNTRDALRAAIRWGFVMGVAATTIFIVLITALIEWLL